MVSVPDATKAMQVRSSDKVLIEIDGVVSKKKNVFSMIPSALVRVHYMMATLPRCPYRDVLVRAAEAKRNSVQSLAGRLFKGKMAAAGVGKNFSKFRLVIRSDATFDMLVGPEPLFLQEPATMELEFTVSKGNSFSVRVPCRLRAEPAAYVFPQAAALDAYFEDGECVEPSCHAHWHGVPFWTWWTSCHGNCGAGLDCRCKARPPGQRGFKVCQEWMFCNCV